MLETFLFRKNCAYQVFGRRRELFLGQLILRLPLPSNIMMTYKNFFFRENIRKYKKNPQEELKTFILIYSAQQSISTKSSTNSKKNFNQFLRLEARLAAPEVNLSAMPNTTERHPKFSNPTGFNLGVDAYFIYGSKGF